MKRIAVTITTINKPTVLENLLNLQREVEESDVEYDYIVAGDRKTPLEVADYIAMLDREYSPRLTYFDLDGQKRRFSHLKDLWNHVLPDSFSRRNFADLYAYWEGYDAVVRIDDDNYPVDSGFFSGHSIVGTDREMTVVESDSGWYNVCDTLEERSGIAFYPRGYPYPDRWNDGGVTTRRETVHVGINAGLWLGDPDVDAVTRLNRPVDAVRYREEMFGPVFALARGTWCPINTQNTAYIRETMPASFVSPHAGRLNDILMGYYLRAIMDHLGHHVTYGRPLLDQKRNDHDLWRDLADEMESRSLPHVLAAMRELRFSADSYLGCYAELIAHLRANIDRDVVYHRAILDGMEIWANVFAAS